MAITEEDVVQLYDALRGRTFKGTNRGIWQFRNSWDPQIREVIATPQLEGELQRTLTAVKDRLEGQVWRGFVPHEIGWKLCVVLDSKQNVGDEGLYTIKRFRSFSYHMAGPGICKSHGRFELLSNWPRTPNNH